MLTPEIKKYLAEQGSKGGKKHSTTHFQKMQKASVIARKRNKREAKKFLSTPLLAQ